MARTVDRLTPKEVANAKPTKNGARSALLADGGCLYLQATLGREGNVRRSWLFRYEMDGERHEMGLGPLHDVGLAEAREQAHRLRQLIRDGIDPLQDRRQAEQARLAEKAQTVTFRACAKSYIALHEDSWKNGKHRQQWDSTLATYVYPVIGDMSVRDVDSASIMKIVEPLWGTKTETASRVRGRIEAILDYAAASGFRKGDNPARHVVRALPRRSKVRKVEHHPALPYQEIPDFMAALHTRDSLSARALEWTILTAARTSETLGLTRAEINEKTKTWTVPADRMKGAREHRIPLPDRCLEILRGLRGEQPFALSNMAMLKVMRSMRPEYVPHGFRATFKTWASERTNYARAIVEAALAHVIGDKTEAAYDRGDLFDKRRRLMNDWAKYCSSKPVADGAVVPLRKAGADA